MIRTSVPMDHTDPERVNADAYGLNPMVTSVSAKDPKTFAAASDRAPAPTLFASGDLPPFTASGVDPNLLARLPFGVRHSAAADPHAASVLAMVEEVASEPDRMSAHIIWTDGLRDYQRRVAAWVKDADLLARPAVGEAGYPEQWRSATMHEADRLRRADAQAGVPGERS